MTERGEPSLSEALNSVDGIGTSTAPTLTTAEELAELRAENARLRGLLEPGKVALDATVSGGRRRINYKQLPMSNTRLAELAERVHQNRERIRDSSEFPDLPVPTTELAQLEDDFMRWGYCLVENALSPEQVEALSRRLVDQAEAEKAAGVAHLTHRKNAQFLPNLLAKGQEFRDLAELAPSMAAEAQLVEQILDASLGESYTLGTTHGSLVHEGGGRQDLHQDQGWVPLPHPPFPLYLLVVWTLTDFSLDLGATIVMPGSHADADGRNVVRADADIEGMDDQRIVSINAPAGTCILTDSRVIHAGGRRSVPGTRLAIRNLYNRVYMRGQENQLVCVPRELFDAMSPKLQELVGVNSFMSVGMVEGNALNPKWPKIPVGELSMDRPEEFEQDFDWRYTLDAKALAAREWDDVVDYRGER